MRCIDCTYPDGSGSGTCLVDPSDPLPDVMAGRPADLPPPGACTTRRSQGGLVECSTCTAYDLSATMSCRFPPAASCYYTSGEDGRICIGCPVARGGTALICDPPAE